MASIIPVSIEISNADTAQFLKDCDVQFEPNQESSEIVYQLRDAILGDVGKIRLCKASENQSRRIIEEPTYPTNQETLKHQERLRAYDCDTAQLSLRIRFGLLDEAKEIALRELKNHSFAERVSLLYGIKVPLGAMSMNGDDFGMLSNDEDAASIRDAREKFGAAKDALCNERMERHKQIISAMLTTKQATAIQATNKRTRQRYSDQEQREAVMAWETFDKGTNPLTLEKWLDERFGNEDGTLNVPPSTFYGWRKKWLKKP